MTTVNINVHNDHDFYQVFQYTTVANAPINITGATMVMMLRRHAKDEAAVLKLTTDANGGITLTNPSQGFFAVLIPQESLERLGTGDFDQSLIMTLGGRKTGIWNGVLTNNAGPSR